MSDRISFVVRLAAKPGLVAEVEARLLRVVEDMAQEPDFVNTWLHHPLGDPDTIVLYETWDCSLEHFMAHHAMAPYRAEYEAVLPGLLREERSAQVLLPYHAVMK